MAQQSLYRRYRPRRFSEIKGQEHVVRALRNAVATEREGQAYLFSGPRGTGKTTSARILAKVLNCQNPVDGEPCCECESCKSVEAGTSFDVIELDAASNNKVDDIRELIERVNLSTPGRHKVYILDEVHMLTPGAEAALLKTLEEPPPHVVFVLATTDPQKVRDTIRSRTQHLSFHLLNEQELQDHVRWVAEDAGIELTDDAVEAVVRQGAGSARDTLSALEVVAAGGGVAPEALPLDEFVEAIIEHDAGRALAAIAASAHLGRDARSVAEAVLAHLRECFLSIMAPELVQLPQHRAEVVAEQAHRLGAAAAVRAMEGLGDILVEMRHAPDPRVLLEVALVKLTSAAVGNDVAALMARIERLERQVAQGGGGANTGPIPRPVATDPATGRAVLGGRARQSAPAPAEAAGSPTESARVSPPLPPVAAAPVAAAPVASEPAAPPVARPSVDPTPAGGVPRPAAPAAAAAPSAHATSTADLAKLFEDVVKPGLKGMAKALFFAAVPRGMRDGVLVLVVPNEGHLKRASEYQAEIEKQLGAAAGTPARIVLETENAPATGGPRGGRTDRLTTEPAEASSMDDLNDLADLGELRDAPPEDHKSPVQRVQDMFPGSELIEGGD